MNRQTTGIPLTTSLALFATSHPMPIPQKPNHNIPIYCREYEVAFPLPALWSFPWRLGSSLLCPFRRRRDSPTTPSPLRPPQQAGQQQETLDDNDVCLASPASYFPACSTDMASFDSTLPPHRGDRQLSARTTCWPPPLLVCARAGAGLLRLTQPTSLGHDVNQSLWKYLENLASI